MNPDHQSRPPFSFLQSCGGISRCLFFSCPRACAAPISRRLASVASIPFARLGKSRLGETDVHLSVDYFVGDQISFQNARFWMGKLGGTWWRWRSLSRSSPSSRTQLSRFIRSWVTFCSRYSSRVVKETLISPRRIKKRCSSVHAHPTSRRAVKTTATKT
jgi:hypothetical protein